MGFGGGAVGGSTLAPLPPLLVLPEAAELREHPPRVLTPLGPCRSEGMGGDVTGPFLPNPWGGQNGETPQELLNTKCEFQRKVGEMKALGRPGVGFQRRQKSCWLENAKNWVLAN